MFVQLFQCFLSRSNAKTAPTTMMTMMMATTEGTNSASTGDAGACVAGGAVAAGSEADIDVSAQEP